MRSFNRHDLRVVFIVVVLFLAGAVSAGVYSHYNGDLSSGEFNNTLYNSSGFVHLNWTDGTNTSYVESGNYTSEVIDMGSETGFTEISWRGYGSCPENMSYINKLGGYCIDNYEAIALNSDGSWNSSSDDNDWDATSTDNLLSDGGYAGSASGYYPWVYISQTEAKTACENAGKYLCSDEEWLGAANIKGQVYNLPSTITDCNVESGSPAECTGSGPNNGDACVTGYMSDCRSEEGVYDMVGNVLEWTDEEVDTIKPCNSGSVGWCYPNSTNGWQTSDDANTDIYGDDAVYFVENTGTGRAVLRGGRWSNGAHAGLFCANLNLYSGTTSYAIGFRCCSEVNG
jgi:formylglycine-generating enzyme required for sulfatase activity